MPLFNRRHRPRYHHVANKAVAARAVFQEAPGAIPKVSLTFDLIDGTTHTFELDAMEAGKFINQSIAAYNSIMPPIRTGQGGWGT